MRSAAATRIAGLTVALTALVALTLPTLAPAQAKGPTLTEAPDSAFPDRVYLLQLPTARTLNASQVTITENGSVPAGQIGIEAPGASSGVILLIDASLSMKGEPIEQAMAAARAFMNVRAEQMPVAVVAYNPEQHVLTDFTTDAEALNDAVATTPEVVLGTEIYDSLILAADMAKEKELRRGTVVLLSDGNENLSESGFADALAALEEANLRVISVGFESIRYSPRRLKALSAGTGGTFHPASAEEFVPVFEQIGKRLSREYLLYYRSLLPGDTPVNVRATVAGAGTATTSYTTPHIDFTDRGTFEETRTDKIITSPFLMAFVVASILALLLFALFTVIDVRSRSVRRRMAEYVNIPTEDESRQRRAEVAGMLAERAQRRVEGHRWWQSFERDVELAGIKKTPATLGAWTLIGAILLSLITAIVFQSPLGLLTGLVAPFVTHLVVQQRLKKVRSSFADELPDNLEVLAGALRAGHSLIGAMGVMVDGATEPSKSEFRRVLQDEQLGVPLDDALMVMARRMDNLDVEQVAIVTKLQREAGGNTAEVLDRVVENIRGRMELRRLVRVLTAQGRIARYILTAIPIVLLFFFFSVNKVWLEPLWETGAGRFALGAWVVLLIGGWFAIKKIVEIEV
jgi:tight adherence protein B